MGSEVNQINTLVAQILPLHKTPLTCKNQDHIIVRVRENHVCEMLAQNNLLVNDCSMKEEGITNQ